MATRFDVIGTATLPGAGHACGRCRPWLGVLRRAGRSAVILAVALAAVACGGERTYTAEPIGARIVDTDTGAPVEGVNVVAAWQARGGLEGGNIMGYVNVMEDVTNANGEFSFPGWGPKKWRNGAIRDGAPLLILLKPTYEVRFLWETKYGVEFAPSHMSSSWNGKSIHIKKFTRANDEYSQSHVGLWTVIDTLVAQPDCAWRGIPRFLNAVDRQRQATLNAGGTSVLSSLDGLQDNVNKSCGSLKAVVLERVQ
jgi:hypothetical protein